MYYVITTYHRPSLNVPYYANSVANNAAAIAQAYNAAYPPKGNSFGGRLILNGSDNLHGILVEKWASKVVYDAWIAANQSPITSFESARDAYNTAVGIHMKQLKVEDPVSLF